VQAVLVSIVARSLHDKEIAYHEELVLSDAPAALRALDDALDAAGQALERPDPCAGPRLGQ
jgi:hypothetical protein